MKTLKVFLAVVMLLAIVLAGCAPKPTPVAPTEAPVAPTEAPVAPTEAPVEVVTLRQWDELTEEADSAVMDAAIAEFQSLHPNIQIVREPIPEVTMREITKTVFNAGNAPDIITRDFGPGTGGLLAREGYVIPLDDAYTEYGWDERVLPWAANLSMVGGKKYALPAMTEYVGVYYNKAILNELGVEVPKTHEEFIAMAELAKAAGYIPIALGNMDMWPGSHWFTYLIGNLMGSAGALNDVIQGCESLDRPESLRAAQIYEEFATQGYFTPEANGLSYEDANALFTAGRAAAYLTGTWMLKDFEAALGENLAFELYPSIEGSPVVGIGSVGYGFYVTAQSQHQEEALLWLDFLFSDEMNKKFIEEASVAAGRPVAAPIEEFNISPMMKSAMSLLQTVPEWGLHFEASLAEPSMLVLYEAYAAMLIGEETAEGFIKKLQAAWEQDIAAGRVECR